MGPRISLGISFFREIFGSLDMNQVSHTATILRSTSRGGSSVCRGTESAKAPCDGRSAMGTKGLRNGAIVSFVVSMAILLVGGHFAKEKVPPIPGRVVAVEGGAEKLLTKKPAIRAGQDVYQRYGLMDHGSVWGHGSLRGMDFSAHTLHCVGALVRQYHASQGQPAAEAYKDLPPKPRRELDE